MVFLNDRGRVVTGGSVVVLAGAVVVRSRCNSRRVATAYMSHADRSPV